MSHRNVARQHTWQRYQTCYRLERTLVSCFVPRHWWGVVHPTTVSSRWAEHKVNGKKLPLAVIECVVSKSGLVGPRCWRPLVCTDVYLLCDVKCTQEKSCTTACTLGKSGAYHREDAGREHQSVRNLRNLEFERFNCSRILTRHRQSVRCSFKWRIYYIILKRSSCNCKDNVTAIARKLLVVSAQFSKS